MAEPVPKQRFAEAEWVRRFAERLQNRLPSVHPEEAQDIADGEYLAYCDICPEEAAESYADELPPSTIDPLT